MMMETGAVDATVTVTIGVHMVVGDAVMVHVVMMRGVAVVVDVGRGGGRQSSDGNGCAKSDGLQHDDLLLLDEDGDRHRAAFRTCRTCFLTLQQSEICGGALAPHAAS